MDVSCTSRNPASVQIVATGYIQQAMSHIVNMKRMPEQLSIDILQFIFSVCRSIAQCLAGLYVNSVPVALLFEQRHSNKLYCSI